MFQEDFVAPTPTVKRGKEADVPVTRCKYDSWIKTVLSSKVGPMRFYQSSSEGEGTDNCFCRVNELQRSVLAKRREYRSVQVEQDSGTRDCCHFRVWRNDSHQDDQEGCLGDVPEFNIFKHPTRKFYVSRLHSANIVGETFPFAHPDWNSADSPSTNNKSHFAPSRRKLYLTHGPCKFRY